VYQNGELMKEIVLQTNKDILCQKAERKLKTIHDFNY